MSVIEQAFSDGQLAAWRRHKLAWPSTTNPVVQQSAILKSQPTPPQPPVPAPASTPAVISETFDRHEQGETRMEPRRKLSTEACGTCRKPKHYGPCRKPIPIKQSSFNLGMTPGDASDGGPSTSPHYHSATSADSALARARDGRPADEQASSAFADLFRHLGVTSVANEPGRMYGGLSKVSRFMLPGAEANSVYEKRGPSPNPYEERVMAKSPPVGWGDEGRQRIDRAFDGVDNAVDSTCVESVAP
jgi:hypothetical protein